MAVKSKQFYKEFQKRLGKGFSRDDARYIAQTYADTIVELLVLEDYIKLPALGTIEVKYSKPYGVIDEPYFKAYFRFAERAKRAYKYKIIDED